jgi:hypothetical protein
MISVDFINQLRRLDRTLVLRLNREKQRYVIYRKDRQNVPREILVIENPDGEFCYPNREHIVQLYKADLWQNPDMIKKMDEHNERLDEESDRHIHFLSDEMSKLATRTKYY